MAQSIKKFEDGQYEAKVKGYDNSGDYITCIGKVEIYSCGCVTCVEICDSDGEEMDSVKLNEDRWFETPSFFKISCESCELEDACVDKRTMKLIKSYDEDEDDEE